MRSQIEFTAGHGVAPQGTVRQGGARRCVVPRCGARQGIARSGSERHGRGTLCNSHDTVLAWLGTLGHGPVRWGDAWLGLAWRVAVRRVMERRGKAEQGKDTLMKHGGQRWLNLN